MLAKMENTIKKVRMNLKDAQDKKKTYVDKGRIYKESQV